MAVKHQTTPIDRNAIHPREWEALLKIVIEYRLDLHDPQLLTTLQSINPEKPSSLNLKLWESVKEKVSKYMKYHEENPFITAPQESVTQGEFILSKQKANNAPVHISRDGLTKNMLLCSATGGGKTTLAHHILHQTLQAGIKAFIIDPKDDARYIAAQYGDFLVIHPGARFNLLQVPSYLTFPEFISTFITCFTRAYYGGELSKQVLNEALQKVFSEKQSPSLKDLQETVDGLHDKRDTYSRRDAVRGISLRLQRIGYLYETIYSTRRGITYDELFKRSIYLPIGMMDETSEFIYSYLIHQLFHHNRAKGIRNTLDTIILFDEGLLGWNKSQSKIEGSPLLSQLISMTREWGIANLITTTSIGQLDPILKSNVNTQISMIVVSGQESHEISYTFNLTREQKAYLETKLCLGECIIKTSNEWKYPILSTFPPLTVSKNIPQKEWEEAKERINKYAPMEEPTPEIMTDPDPIREERKTDSKDAQSRPGKESIPKKDEKIPDEKPSHPKDILKLSQNDSKLIQILFKRIMPATQAYLEAGLSRDAGNNSKRRLAKLGLLTEEVITIKKGRGGQANILLPTMQASKLLKIKPSRATRGGDSPQHRYLVQELAGLIPKSHEEYTLDNKSADIFLVYQDEIHKELKQSIQDIGTPLSEQDYIHWDDASTIAIEVECSDPIKTGIPNIKKNHHAGISLTILAIQSKQLPRIIKTLKEKIPHNLRKHVTLVDALQLLKELRKNQDDQRGTD